jgi:hypothetical protein
MRSVRAAQGQLRALLPPRTLRMLG